MMSGDSAAPFDTQATPSQLMPLSPDIRTDWIVVTQVKANRVVYFTDDPSYQPPMEGDWYFVSHHVGALPADMTLRNCWGWRFNGGVFSDVRPQGAVAGTAQGLLESNRRALLSLLREKVDKSRKQWASTCVLGDEIRWEKLRQAREYLALGPNAAADSETFSLLGVVADARGMTLVEAAEMLIDRQRTTRQAVVASESLRERMTQAIQAAQTQEELIFLRERILQEIAPSQTKDFAFPAAPMEPRDWEAPLSAVHRAHEVARLRTALREAVNSRRSRVHDGYIEDEALIRHKAKLAQGILNNEGKAPTGTDCSLLESFAQARGLSLMDASRLILGTVGEAETTLMRTELLKDRLLPEIERISNLRDVQRMDQKIAALGKGEPGR